MLFDRVYELVIGEEGGRGVKITDLRVSFSIEKGATRSPNKCTCRIYNLNKTSRDLVQVIGNVLILKAGYAQDKGALTIFTGTVTRYITIMEGPDRVTEIEMADGLLEFQDTKASIEFGPGTLASDVLRNISGRFNLPVRAFPEIQPLQYPTGFYFVGRLRDAMDKVCTYLDLEWSIQNREVQVIKKGGVFKQKAIILSPDSGLIGAPETDAKTMTDKAAAKLGITPDQRGVDTTFRINKDGNRQERLRVLGYKVDSLLQPTIQPGGYVKLESGDINDFFRVEKLTHIGDTRGAEWKTEMVLRFI